MRISSTIDGEAKCAFHISTNLTRANIQLFVTLVCLTRNYNYSDSELGVQTSLISFSGLGKRR